MSVCGMVWRTYIIRKTGEALPSKFFFVLSSFGSFCYMKTPKAKLKRIVVLGDGRTRNMYEFLAPIVGFNYKIHACKAFEKAMSKIKTGILPTLFTLVAVAMKRGFESI